MKRCKFYHLAAGMCLSLFLFMAGCSDNTQDGKQISETDSTITQPDTYKLKTLSQRKVTIEGPATVNAMAFQGGQTTDKIEIVFDSLKQSVNTEGNKIKKITIKELKYFSEVRDSTVIDFDSSKDKGPNDALAALIGKSYTIEVAPSGHVEKISDVDVIIGYIEDIPSNLEVALRLVSEEAIKKRHSISLPDIKVDELKVGDTWDNDINFDFGLMGDGSYERTYKVEKIVEIGKSKPVNIASIEMNAIPSAEGMPEVGSTAVPPMTDIRQTYTGTMELDITNAKLLKYQEELVNVWLVVPPGTGQDGPPSVLNMTATRSYDIEKIK